MGRDREQGGVSPAAGTSIHDYAQIYPDPDLCGRVFIWETVSGGLGDSEPITHFRLNAPPNRGFPMSRLPLIFQPETSVGKMVRLTSKALKLYRLFPFPLEGPIATVPTNVASAVARDVRGLHFRPKDTTATTPPPPQQVSMSSAPAQKFVILPNPVVTAPEGAQRPPISTKPPPPPPHLFSSTSAPAEKLALLPNPLVTPPSSDPEGAQPPPSSTQPPPPQVSSSSSAPAQKFVILPNPVVTAPEGAQRPPISTKPPPPPPHLFSSSSAPAEKLALLPNPLVTPTSSDPEGAQPPPSSTQPHPPQVSSSSSAPDEKLALLPNPVVTAPEWAHRPPSYAAPPKPMAHRPPSYAAPPKPMTLRHPSYAGLPKPMADTYNAPSPSSLKNSLKKKHPFLLPRDLSPPPVSAARPRLRIPRLRKAGPKLDPELKAELAWIAEREKGFPADIVIAFVEELDKAHQYARFNNYIREEYGKIKHDSVPNDIAYELTKDNERTKKFSLVDEYDIHTLVEAYVRDCDLIQMHYYAKEAEKPVLGSLSNPVYYLEYRAREEGYVLNQKPEAELKKLKKFAPMFYSNYFVLREPPAVVEARTVTVSNIAFDVPEKKIREFFRVCGCITCFETESTPECQIAHITFKDLQSVERAQTFTSAKKALISMENAPLLVLPKFVLGASDAVSLAVETEDVAKALQRYAELRTYYSQFQSKHVKPAKKEGYGRCGGMDWMGMECLVNGGYTVGGQKLPRHPKAL